MLSIRPAHGSDEPFLREMLYLALFVPPGAEQFPPEVVEEPMLAHHVDEFGSREGDVGFIAEVDSEPVGAAWVRQFTSEDPSYGYVDDHTPELSIAMRPEHRGRGIGLALMNALIEAVPESRLSVDDRNPAIGLYCELGYETVETDGHSVTMVRRRTLTVHSNPP